MHITSCRVILYTLLLYSSLGDYSFQYRVTNNDDSVQYSHEEDRSQDDTTGHYQVLLPDGRTQVVTYSIPDKDTGYLARVQYQQRNRDTQRKREIIKKVYRKPSTVKQRRNDSKYQSFIKKLYGVSPNGGIPTNQTFGHVKTYDIIEAKITDTINDEKAFNNSSYDNTGESFEHYSDIMTQVGAQKDNLIDNKLDEDIDANFKIKTPISQYEYSSSEKMGHDKALQEETMSRPVDSMFQNIEQTENEIENTTNEFPTSIPDSLSITKSGRLRKKAFVSTDNLKKQQFDANNASTNIEYDKSSGTYDLLTVTPGDHEVAENKRIPNMEEKDNPNEQYKAMDDIKNKVKSDINQQTFRHPVMLTESIRGNEIYNDDIVQEVFEDNFDVKHLKDTDHEKNKDEPHKEYQTIKTSMEFPDHIQGNGKKKIQSINKQAFSNSQKHSGNYQMIEGQRSPLQLQEKNIVTFRKKRKVSNQAISYFQCIKTFLFNLLPFDL